MCVFLGTSVLEQGVSVGDSVQYQCFCLGAEWVRGKVERVAGGNVRVRYGNMNNQVVTLPVNSPKLKTGNAARNPLETIPMTPGSVHSTTRLASTKMRSRRLPIIMTPDTSPEI
ncbi:MAG: hypothetical protein IPG58_11000 [Acidobacteria bacterium]|nr:hypothetical protein [Acidobacteriota bacterium]